MAVMDAGGNKVGRNSAGMKSRSPSRGRPVRRDARRHRAAGGGGAPGQLLPKALSKKEMGTQDKFCLCHRCLDMKVVIPGHGFPDVGGERGEKHREPVTAETVPGIPLSTPSPRGQVLPGLRFQGWVRDACGYQSLSHGHGEQGAKFWFPEHQ